MGGIFNGIRIGDLCEEDFRFGRQVQGLPLFVKATFGRKRIGGPDNFSSINAVCYLKPKGSQAAVRQCVAKIYKSGSDTTLHTHSFNHPPETPSLIQTCSLKSSSSPLPSLPLSLAPPSLGSKILATLALCNVATKPLRLTQTRPTS